MLCSVFVLNCLNNNFVQHLPAPVEALTPDGLILESYLPSPIIESKIRFSIARRFDVDLQDIQI